MADACFGLRVSDVDHAMSEVQVSEVQLARLAVAQAGGAERREDRPAGARVTRFVTPAGEPDRCGLGDAELGCDLLPGLAMAAHAPRQLGARERVLGDWLVDRGCRLDQREQLVGLEEVPLAVRHLQSEVAVARGIPREQPTLDRVVEDPRREVEGHVDRARAE